MSLGWARAGGARCSGCLQWILGFQDSRIYIFKDLRSKDLRNKVLGLPALDLRITDLRMKGFENLRNKDLKI